MADRFKGERFPLGHLSPENEFWRLVSSGSNEDVVVEYGSDLEGSGEMIKFWLKIVNRSSLQLLTFVLGIFNYLPNASGSLGGCVNSADNSRLKSPRMDVG